MVPVEPKGHVSVKCECCTGTRYVSVAQARSYKDNPWPPPTAPASRPKSPAVKPPPKRK